MAQTIGTLDLTIMWAAPPFGYFDDYMLSYREQGSLIPTSQVLDKTAISHKLQGLLPNTPYTLELVARSGTGDSASQSEAITTSVTTGKTNERNKFIQTHHQTPHLCHTFVLIDLFHEIC